MTAWAMACFVAPPAHSDSAIVLAAVVVAAVDGVAWVQPWIDGARQRWTWLRGLVAQQLEEVGGGLEELVGAGDLPGDGAFGPRRARRRQRPRSRRSSPPVRSSQ